MEFLNEDGEAMHNVKEGNMLGSFSVHWILFVESIVCLLSAAASCWCLWENVFISRKGLHTAWQCK